MKSFRAGVAIAAFAAAVSTYAAATSVNLPDPGPGNYNFFPAATYDGVTFAALKPAISGVGTSIGADQVNFFDDTFGGYIDLTFTSATTFSTVLAQGYSGSSGSLLVTVYDGATLIDTESVIVGGQDSFTAFSLSGIGSFTGIDFDTTNGSQFPGIAQIQVNTAAVPETSTWALMLLGIGGLGAMLRTSRRRLPAMG